MPTRKTVVSLVAIVAVAAIYWLVVWHNAPGDAGFQPGPSRENFERLRMGMTLPEVKSVMGPVGLSYSSDLSYQYYIVKGSDGWSRIYIQEGTVSELSFDDTLTVEGEETFRARLLRWLGFRQPEEWAPN